MHIVFDDANFTVLANQRSPTSQILIDLGYQQSDYEASVISGTPNINLVAKIQLLSTLAVMPTRGSSDAAGYDVSSTISVE